MDVLLSVPRHKMGSDTEDPNHLATVLLCSLFHGSIQLLVVCMISDIFDTKNHFPKFKIFIFFP